MTPHTVPRRTFLKASAAAADTSMVGSIRTAVPGVRFSELFPKFAASAAKRAAILRSLQTKVPDHALGRYYSHTGYRATGRWWRRSWPTRTPRCPGSCRSGRCSGR